MLQTAKSDDPAVIRQLCGSPGPVRKLVTALHNEHGNIGGYTISQAIMDSPIAYVDIHGEGIATFHIFGQPQKSGAHPEWIDVINQRFPKQRRIVCPK